PQRCDVKITHVPRSRSARTCPKSHSTSRPASADVGSSRNRICGSRTSARTISSTWRCASESAATSSSGSICSTPYWAKIAAARPGRARRRISGTGQRGSLPISRFSATVIHGISVSSWKTVATPSACASCGRARSTSSPRIRTTPSSALRTPERILIIVLLRAPFAARSAWTSRNSATNDAPRRARTPPNDLEMPDASIARGVRSFLSSGRVSAADPVTPSSLLRVGRVVVPRDVDLQRPRTCLAGERARHADLHDRIRTGVRECVEEAVGHVCEDVLAELGRLLGRLREGQPDGPLRRSVGLRQHGPRHLEGDDDVERRLAEREAVVELLAVIADEEAAVAVLAFAADDRRQRPAGGEDRLEDP